MACGVPKLPSWFGHRETETCHHKVQSVTSEMASVKQPQVTRSAREKAQGPGEVECSGVQDLASFRFDPSTHPLTNVCIAACWPAEFNRRTSVDDSSTEQSQTTDCLSLYLSDRPKFLASQNLLSLSLSCRLKSLSEPTFLAKSGEQGNKQDHDSAKRNKQHTSISAQTLEPSTPSGVDRELRIPCASAINCRRTHQLSRFLPTNEKAMFIASVMPSDFRALSLCPPRTSRCRQ